MKPRIIPTSNNTPRIRIKKFSHAKPINKPSMPAIYFLAAHSPNKISMNADNAITGIVM